MISITTTDKGYYRGAEDVTLRGAFRHQQYSPHQPYVVRVFPNEGAMLSAVPTVIQAREYGDLGKPAADHNVAEGDVIEVDGVQYRITDDQWGYDPRLIPVEAAAR
ncbi:hypothetical protein PBI_THONKO_100 [Mycobacterium phage Thonko]|uniref:Uncharacterized protein n=1 Tax=Mycobacterium phage Thonko TaxID=2282910 RepID=A0A346FCE5_9CAUD|nr:hypothetical protein I5G57_gp100 [Mycobacterium phage Thonko]AXN53370.1 hypothetical protein PBI_THONKO_100 [Mycobacterium phage Thonko]